MKLFLVPIICLVQLISHAQAENVEITGYGKIKLGVALSEVQALLTELNTVPSYAWFSPMGFDDAVDMMEMETPLSAEDSAMIDGYMMEFEGMEEGKIYIPSDKEHSVFVGLRIAAIKLICDESNIITHIMIALDSKDVSEITKEQLTNLLEAKFGEPYCNMSIVPEGRYPYYCSWEDAKEEFQIVVSDMREPGGSMGKSLNITIGKY